MAIGPPPASKRPLLGRGLGHHKPEWHADRFTSRALDYAYDTNTYVIGVDGANRRLLAQEASEPVFSPDGKRIAYMKHIAPQEAESHSHAIETIAPDGTNRRTLVHYEGWADWGDYTAPGRFDFAPDGSKLLDPMERGSVRGWR